MQCRSSYISGSFLFVCLVFIVILSTISCGGGDDSNAGIKPIANAGEDQTVSENQTVQLTGSQSIDSDGIIKAYQWRQLSGPTDMLNGADMSSADLYFTIPLVSGDTELLFELTVTDDVGLFDKDEVSIFVLDNIPPVADAGADQQVLESQFVTLDGTQSQDDDGSIAAYRWTQISGNSIVNDPDFDASSPAPSFTAPNSSEKLSFYLTVTDNLGEEDTDQIDIYVSRVLFEDDFSHGLDDAVWVKVDDSAGIGNSSLWIISGNALQQSNNVDKLSQGSPFDQSFHKGTYRYLDTTAVLTDYRIQADIIPLTNGPSQSMDGNDVGIMFRYQNNDNYYRLTMNARYGFTRLEKKVGGQFTSLAVNSIGYYDDVPTDFMIDLNGSKIHVLIDNEPIFYITDSDLASGSVALYCQDKAKFDNVLITDPGLEPRVIIDTPLAYMVTTDAALDLNVSAQVANLPDGARIEFLLNENTDTAKTILQAPFMTQFTGLSAGEYEVAAVLRDADGNELDRDTNQAVGIDGGYYIAVGDSITNGGGDRFESDNISNDGRTIGVQGYQANLNDKLTEHFDLPQIVFNEGIPGDTADSALSAIDSILDRHAQAENVLLLLGTNDVGESVSTNTFFNNMQTLVNSINSAGLTARYALVPPQFRTDTGLPDTTTNDRIVLYNDALVNLNNAQQGPDLYSFFLNNDGLFYDGLHPNSLGHACIAKLWFNKLTGAISSPFILYQFQTPALYQQNLLEAGDLFYIDESYTLEYIPLEISSGIWIMTDNGDKINTDAAFISFDLDREATVYVAYDGRDGVTLPGWLSGSFVDANLQISTTAGVFNLYSRLYNTETVVLGGNHADGGTGQFNYSVIVKE
jgi:lysophospholipase L1-like esterase